MEIPKAIKADNDKCLILKKTIYGLVKRLWCNGSSVDPCLWIKCSDHRVTLCANYMDVSLVNDTNSGVDDIISNLKRHGFGLMSLHNVTGHSSCRICEL
jgi:hypothetical protein